MKKLFTLTFIFALIATSHLGYAQGKAKVSTFGKKIDGSNAIDASLLDRNMQGKETINIKLKGKIKEVCQRKGCWMNIDIGDGKEMKVRFKDYGFFVPKDAAGKIVVMEGVATREETSVQELRHYAEDAGKSKEEIEKINQPEKSTSFEASGVLIYNE